VHIFCVSCGSTISFSKYEHPVSFRKANSLYFFVSNKYIDYLITDGYVRYKFYNMARCAIVHETFQPEAQTKTFSAEIEMRLKQDITKLFRDKTETALSPDKTMARR